MILWVMAIMYDVVIVGEKDSYPSLMICINELVVNRAYSVIFVDNCKVNFLQCGENVKVQTL